MDAFEIYHGRLRRGLCQRIQEVIAPRPITNDVGTYSNRLRILRRAFKLIMKDEEMCKIGDAKETVLLEERSRT